MSKVERDTVAELLRQSTPRPAPAADQVAAARAALRNEWHEMSGRHRARRQRRTLALAASVLLGAFVVFQVLEAPVVPAVPVASIDKTFGTVYLLGKNSELRPTDELETVLSGQTIVTGHGAGLAVSGANGGSIRVDEDTRIRFVDAGTALLENGKVYYDSSPGLSAGGDAGHAPDFALETDQGSIAHLGTQYMAEVGKNRLVVSVREGEVMVSGRYHDQRVESGQQATLAGAQRPQVLNISRSGERWEWIERTTPAIEVDGHTLHEFLSWVSRELGLEIRFEGSAETIARDAVLRGRIDTSPTDALRLRLATAALDWRIEEGLIYISD
jgi:ferric-dicitrate binding protein FerR (iron transport regulator)